MSNGYCPSSVSFDVSFMAISSTRMTRRPSIALWRFFSKSGCGGFSCELSSLQCRRLVQQGFFMNSWNDDKKNQFFILHSYLSNSQKPLQMIKKTLKIAILNRHAASRLVTTSNLRRVIHCRSPASHCESPLEATTVSHCEESQWWWCSRTAAGWHNERCERQFADRPCLVKFTMWKIIDNHRAHRFPMWTCPLLHTKFASD